MGNGDTAAVVNDDVDGESDDGDGDGHDKSDDQDDTNKVVMLQDLLRMLGRVTKFAHHRYESF